MSLSKRAHCLFSFPEILPTAGTPSLPKALHCGVESTAPAAEWWGRVACFLQQRQRLNCLLPLLRARWCKKKMRQDGPMCLADGHLDTWRRIIIFCWTIKIRGTGQKIQRSIKSHIPKHREEKKPSKHKDCFTGKSNTNWVSYQARGEK